MKQFNNVTICALVTQPARPVGRKQVITPTPVEVWGREHVVTVLNFETSKEKPWLYTDEEQVIDALQPLKADLIISACYGQKIPVQIIQAAKYGGLNVHPSLLPRWRGGDPVPWTILYGDRQTGVTVVRLSDKFDAGEIVAQKKINLRGDELPDPLRTKLFEIGATLLINYLPMCAEKTTPDVVSYLHIGRFQNARRLTRQDGFVPWELIRTAMNLESQGDSSPRFAGVEMTPGDRKVSKLTRATIQLIQQLSIFKSITNYVLPTTNFELAQMLERMVRAFSPWPGVWTIIKLKVRGSSLVEEKRVKIITVHLTTNYELRTTNLSIDLVQLEGKRPMAFTEFMKAYQ